MDCVLWLSLFCCFGESCDHFHVKESRLAFWVRREWEQVLFITLPDIIHQQVRKAILWCITLAEPTKNHSGQELPRQPSRACKN